MSASKSSLAEYEGTIAHLFALHMNEFNSCKDIPEMKGLALRLLDSGKVKCKEAAVKAKRVLGEAKGNHFYSVLGTYMSGIACI